VYNDFGRLFRLLVVFEPVSSSSGSSSLLRETSGGNDMPDGSFFIDERDYIGKEESDNEYQATLAEPINDEMFESLLETMNTRNISRDFRMASHELGVGAVTPPAAPWTMFL
jgi:hypothetical protein